MSAGQLVRLLHATIEGLVLTETAHPKLISDRVARAAFGALAGKK